MGLLRTLFGSSNRDRAKRDQYRPGTVVKNVTSLTGRYGTCFRCEGSGTLTLQCKPCSGTGVHVGSCNRCGGTGRFERAALICHRCNGAGQANGTTCPRCRGTGEFKPAVSNDCRACQGKGTYRAQCRKCGGTGSFTVACKKCDGTGWHKFKG